MAFAERIRNAGAVPAARPWIRIPALTTEGILLAAVVAALAWVPFWLGSNRTLPWGVNAIVFAGLAATYELSLLVRGLPHPVAMQRLRVPALLFAAAVGWIVLQNATWTPAGWHHPIWQLAAEALGEPVSGSISVDRSLTAIALTRLMTAASVFWLALQLSHNPERAKLLIWCVAGIGALYAAIGILAVAFMPDGRVFEEVAQSQFVSSTFVNQNNFATFAGIAFIAAVGLLLKLYRRRLARTGDLMRLKIGTLIETTGNKGALPLALTLTIVTGLLFSGSRGGIIATGVGFLVLVALNVWRERQSLRHEALLLLFAVILVGSVYVGFSDVFVDRIQVHGVDDPGRLRLFTLTILSILTAPLLGFGYGTFVAAFPMFHDESLPMWVLWDKAHNTYLEAFQGLGLLFGTSLIACVALLVWECLKGARTRQHDATIPAIAAAVSFLVGTHALVDFSLQIQAVTLTYMAILGAGVAQARDVPTRLKRSSRRLSVSTEYA